MIKLIWFLVKALISGILRKLYVIVRLYHVRGFYKSRIFFPVKISGKGLIVLGEGTSIYKNADLACQKGAEIILGTGAIIGEGLRIRVSNLAKVSIGNSVLFERGSIFIANFDWKINDSVVIASGCEIFSREKKYHGQLSIGRGSHIGDHCIIDLCDDVTIGEEVALGPNCVVYTHDHKYDNPDLPSWKGGVISAPVSIEDWAWIGANVIILPGVKIGRKSVVAAGSVVTKNVPEGVVVAGIPARIIKTIQNRS